MIQTFQVTRSPKIGDQDSNSINSLAPGRSECDSKNGIYNLVLLIGIFRSSHDNALQLMSQDLTDDKSTLVQVMAWCRQATSHYLSQCWLSPLSPYGVARPQWVHGRNGDICYCFGHWWCLGASFYSTFIYTGHHYFIGRRLWSMR